MQSAPTQPRIIHHRPIEELAEALQNSWKSVCECTARFLREVYEFDLRQGYKEWGYMDTAEWLDFKCGISRVTAREKVRIAKCLVVLSKVEKAFAEGKLSYSKVRALVRVAKLETEDELLEFALRTPASFLEKRLAELRNGSSEGSSDAAHLDRKLWSCEREGDRMVISAELSRADAMLVLEALEKCKGEIAESGLENDGKWDDPARSADALVLMARRSLSGRFRGIARIARQRAPGDGARGRIRAAWQGRRLGPSNQDHEAALVRRPGGGDCREREWGTPVDRKEVPHGADGDPQGARRTRPDLPLSWVLAHQVAGRAPHPALDGWRGDEPEEPRAAVHAPSPAAARRGIPDASPRGRQLLLWEARRQAGGACRGTDTGRGRGDLGAPALGRGQGQALLRACARVRAVFSAFQAADISPSARLQRRKWAMIALSKMPREVVHDLEAKRFVRSSRLICVRRQQLGSRRRNP